jgi:hypothetical protein
MGSRLQCCLHDCLQLAFVQRIQIALQVLLQLRQALSATPDAMISPAM